MKRLITLILIFCSINSIGQITNASYTNKGATVPFINSSSYKLDGITLDSANTVKRGFFTKFQYNKLQTAYGWGNHANLYKGKADSINKSGFATQYDLTQITSSQWKNSGNNIYFKTGNVSINNNRNTVPLTVKGTTVFYDGSSNPALFEIDDTTTGTSLAFFDTQGQRIIFNTTTSGAGAYKVGIGTDGPSQPLDVVGNIKTSTYLIQQGIYAGIYVADGSTAQSIANGTTYIKSTAFTTNGNSSNCTSDAANDKITITKTGKYMVLGTCSFTSGTNSVVWRSCAFLGGVEQSNIHWARKVGTGSDVGSASFMGTINVASVPVDLDVRFRHDQAGAVNITIVYSNVTVNYLGE